MPKNELAPTVDDVWGEIVHTQGCSKLALGDGPLECGDPENCGCREVAGKIHALMPAEISESALRKRVDAAMTDGWNDICSDTGCHPLDIERNFEGRKGHLGFVPNHWAAAIARSLHHGLFGSVQGWVVADANGSRYRTWGDLGPGWTTDIDKALRFARRSDADAFATDDDDAWRILPIRAA